MSKGWNAVAAGLAAAAGLLAAGYYWVLRRPLARTQGTVTLQGLHAEVEVLRDHWGVPHIYALDDHDLNFAQGFVHAQDRLWQMDNQRRLVSGRLAEVLGEVALPLDRWIRVVGMRRVAEQEVSLISAATRANLEAYAAGVNTRIAQGNLPVEFTLLRCKPEPWTVADTLCWIKYLSWSLSVNWEAELLRAHLIDHLGPEQAAELEPAYPRHMPTIVPPGVDLGGIGREAQKRADAARPFTGPPAQGGLGSNNWVVSGTRTVTGAPLLANDPHLPIGIPAIWYENHLVAGEVNVTGVTFPGIPGVIMGHNDHVAWGVTNGFPDVQDLYVEHLRRPGDGRVEYEYQGKWLEAQVIREEIQVKGGETAIEEVIITRHGPILNSLAPGLADLPEAQPVALRWTSLEPDTMIEGMHAMNRARNCVEFREALRHWTGPVQNFVYADSAGNIAYSFPGKIPVRARGDGRVPVPGWTGEYEWTGYIPFDELPHLFNPPQGYVATANNRVVGEECPYDWGCEHITGDRAQRICELLEARDKIDIAYIQRMHFDQLSPAAQILSHALGQLAVDDPELAAVVARMRDWDGTLSVDSPAAAVHEVFLRQMTSIMLRDKLGDLATRYAGQGPTPMLAEGSMFGEKARTWLLEILSNPTSHWFDLGSGETRDEVMRRALRETVDLLKAELGPSMDDWTWGKLHKLTFGHTLGSVKPLDRLFNRGPFPVGGDDTTIWCTMPTAYNLRSQNIIGPVFRFIADLGDLRHCWGLLAPGQSGQPGSKHYDDQVQAWFKAEYHPMLYARGDVEREATERLRLRPTEGNN